MSCTSNTSWQETSSFTNYDLKNSPYIGSIIVGLQIISCVNFLTVPHMNSKIWESNTEGLWDWKACYNQNQPLEVELAVRCGILCKQNKLLEAVIENFI